MEEVHWFLVGLAVVIVGMILMAVFVDYKFQERTAELFIECMDVAETNEQVIACNTRFHR